MHRGVERPPPPAGDVHPLPNWVRGSRDATADCADSILSAVDPASKANAIPITFARQHHCKVVDLVSVIANEGVCDPVTQDSQTTQ